MKIAIASGKGGTGKTMLATNLAAANDNLILLDCDVEEPNCHLFFDLEKVSENKVSVPVPRVDSTKCSLCGKCSEVCQFNAIATLKDTVLVFHELCHSCGGCSRFCPENAIDEVSREVGTITEGKASNVDLVYGKINVGEAQPIPVIKEVKKFANNDNKDVLIDAPPGTSCPVIESVKGADFCILITEPTPFGLNDLKLAVETVRKLSVPAVVVINRADEKSILIRDYCDEVRMKILDEINFDRKIAELYSKGELLISAFPEFKERFRVMLGKIRKYRKTDEQNMLPKRK